ncbi:hypothetical protein RIR_jg32333.t1 [Rhizophagus irregularis DAOM 181602=DAOM 197198]|nr:hypothetical protein RIR_jg32333.t1 [Rhizophagus irregularis DAOM 181602=DAOM 197198]
MSGFGRVLNENLNIIQLLNSMLIGQSALMQRWKHSISQKKFYYCIWDLLKRSCIAVLKSHVSKVFNDGKYLL